MNCRGRCFDFVAPNVEDANSENKNGIRRDRVKELSLAARASLYKPLEKWQTRLLRLHPPSGHESSDGSRDARICADLVIVNMFAADGAVIAGSQQLVPYHALSYVWGSSETTQEILCNSIRLPVTWNLYQALEMFQEFKGSSYLWTDAVCINQKDSHEQSAQVGKMLQLYETATSVIAWLGPTAYDSINIKLCCENLSAIKETISDSLLEHHTEGCISRSRCIYTALLQFYSRPWLSRMWIRQEIYAAKRLIVRCGNHSITWTEFLRCGYLLRSLQHFLSGSRSHGTLLDGVINLLNEAEKNAPTYISSVKRKRDLLEVMMQARNYGVGREHDTFYAVLGMCGIVVQNNLPEMRDPELLQHSILVDYNKTISEVYQDSTLYMLKTEHAPSDLHVWEAYKRSVRHGNELPSWVVDWRSGALANEIVAEVRHSKSYLQDLNTPLPATSEVSRALIDGFVTPRQTVPSLMGKGQLSCYAKVVSYVAYVSEYTCNVSALSHIRRGQAGREIHASGKAHRSRFRQTLFEDITCYAVKFDPAKHHSRITILGLGDPAYECVALVPSTAAKGDLVVSISPLVFPIILRPVQHDTAASALYPANDAYQTAPLETGRRSPSRWRRTTFLLDRYLRLVIFSIIFGMPFTVPLVCFVFFAETANAKALGGVGLMLAFLGDMLILFHLEAFIARKADARVAARRAAVLTVLDHAAAQGPFEFHGPAFLQHSMRVGWSKAVESYRARPVQEFVLR